MKAFIQTIAALAATISSCAATPMVLHSHNAGVKTHHTSSPSPDKREATVTAHSVTVAATTTTQTATPTPPTCSLTNLSPYTQCCLSTEMGSGLCDGNLEDMAMAQWTVSIGVPYDNGKGCDNIHAALVSAVGNSTDLFWYEGNDPTQMDGGPQSCNGTSEITYLGFETPFGYSEEVAKALEEMYPEVAGGFDCMDPSDPGGKYECN